MTTLNAQNEDDLLRFERLIATFEQLTELKLSNVRHSANSIWIDWAYPDGTWAGTLSCDSPLCNALEKLEREVITLQHAIIAPDVEFTVSYH